MIDRKKIRIKRSRLRSKLIPEESCEKILEELMMEEMMSDGTPIKIINTRKKSPRRDKTDRKKKNRPFALFPRDFIFVEGNPLIPLNQGQLNSEIAEKSRDRILREYIKQFRADGLHWLLLCHLRALTGKSNPVHISCTALARRISSSGKVDGRWLQLTKDALLALEAAKLIRIEFEHEKHITIYLAPILVEEGGRGYMKIYLDDCNLLRLNAPLALWLILRSQPVYRIIDGWYFSTIAKKVGLSYGHDRARMRSWLRRCLHIINRKIINNKYGRYRMEIKGRPAKVYIEFVKEHLAYNSLL